jgi:ABC-type uncharacterized transport system substrate-binding protein
MNRRSFIAGLALTGATHPMLAQQAAKVWRVAFFTVASGPNYLSEALLKGLRELGYAEGQNLLIEYRWMGGRENQYNAVAQELAKANFDLIITAGHAIALAAKKATSVTPIVALALVDPVQFGLADSLGRPGGNLTGLSEDVSPETSVKMIQLLRDAVPSVVRVGVLWHSANPGSAVFREAMHNATYPTGISLKFQDVQQAVDIQPTISALASNIDGLVVFTESFMWTYRREIVEAVKAARVPTIHGFRDSAEIGGLMSYGPDLVDVFQRGAAYVDKILKGANPADLPIERPTKFELAINVQTAKALGLTIPSMLLARADEVIE